MPISIHDVRSAMIDLAQFICQQSGSTYCPYIQQREVIKTTFQNGKPYSVITIMQRLVVIDSLYSTNASFNYFSFEDMATAIYSLGPQEQDAINYFKEIAQGGVDMNNIFSGKYGIRKNAEPGSVATSLLSKYAYYLLLFQPGNALGFPIYDSLVKEVLPTILLQTLGVEVKKTFLNSCTIEEFIQTVNLLRDAVFNNTTTRMSCLQQFDILDAYLWRLGKIKNGNLSLLFTKNEYIKFVNNLGLSGESLKSAAFDKEVMRKCGTMPTNVILNGIATAPSVFHTLINQCKLIGFL